MKYGIQAITVDVPFQDFKSAHRNWDGKSDLLRCSYKKP